MKVISYGVFHSVDKFEEWQMSTPGIQIIQIQPIMGGIRGNHKEGSCEQFEYDLETSIDVFVTFFKEVGHDL